MKRRNFIGTLAAAITAAGIGITLTKKERQLDHFVKFFEKRNDFKMNGFQIAAYVLYEKGKKFYFPPKQGMTTLFHTIASYESNENNKSVLVVSDGWLMEFKDKSLKGCFSYNHGHFLCGKQYDIIISDIKDDHDFTRGIDSMISDIYPLSYYAETVVAQCGVLKKRYPNYNV